MRMVSGALSAGAEGVRFIAAASARTKFAATDVWPAIRISSPPGSQR